MNLKRFATAAPLRKKWSGAHRSKMIVNRENNPVDSR